MVELEKSCCIHGYHYYRSLWTTTLEQFTYVRDSKERCTVAYRVLLPCTNLGKKFVALINPYRRNFHDKNFMARNGARVKLY